MYPFKKMVCIFLLSSEEIKKRVHLFLVNSFFREDPLDKKTISQKLNCSLERVRQLTLYLNNVAIPLAVNSILNSFLGSPYDLPENDNRVLLYLNNFDEFNFRGIQYTPNVQLSKSVYSYLYRNSYELIDNILHQNYKSFEIPRNYFFISKEFIKKVGLVDFLAWLDDQIYNFEVISFDYNIEVLIKRYFNENNKLIDENSLTILFAVVKKIKKETFDLNEKTVKRVNKKMWIDSILNEVYLFLQNENKGQSTNAILDHLSNENFHIVKLELLRFLNNHKSTFSYFGLGTWMLTEWKTNEVNAVGSFREIVRNLLSKRNDPIHISELHKYINSMKKVSLQSVLSNLKSETNGTFKIFNCSFIGLSEKQYSDYWYKLPRFKAGHLPHNFTKIREIDAEKIINDLNLKYGYPKEHLKFIMETQNRKNS